MLTESNPQRIKALSIVASSLGHAFILPVEIGGAERCIGGRPQVCLKEALRAQAFWHLAEYANFLDPLVQEVASGIFDQVGDTAGNMRHHQRQSGSAARPDRYGPLESKAQVDPAQDGQHGENQEMNGYHRWSAEQELHSKRLHSKLGLLLVSYGFAEHRGIRPALSVALQAVDEPHLEREPEVAEDLTASVPLPGHGIPSLRLR